MAIDWRRVESRLSRRIEVLSRAQQKGTTDDSLAVCVLALGEAEARANSQGATEFDYLLWLTENVWGH